MVADRARSASGCCNRLQLARALPPGSKVTVEQPEVAHKSAEPAVAGWPGVSEIVPFGAPDRMPEVRARCDTAATEAKPVPARALPRW